MKTEELRVKMKAAFDNGYATAIADEAKLDKIRRNKAIDECIAVYINAHLSFHARGAYYYAGRSDKTYFKIESLRVKQS